EFDTLPYDGHGEPMSFLDVAENFEIFLDHACGGVCACTTCHIWVKKGENGISEPEDKELDRMETAADVQLNSRLGCQAVIEKPGTYVVEIPKWNRNYVQEGKPAHGPGSYRGPANLLLYCICARSSAQTVSPSPAGFTAATPNR